MIKLRGLAIPYGVQGRPGGSFGRGMPVVYLRGSLFRLPESPIPVFWKHAGEKIGEATDFEESESGLHSNMILVASNIYEWMRSRNGLFLSGGCRVYASRGRGNVRKYEIEELSFTENPAFPGTAACLR